MTRSRRFCPHLRLIRLLLYLVSWLSLDLRDNVTLMTEAAEPKLVDVWYLSLFKTGESRYNNGTQHCKSKRLLTSPCEVRANRVLLYSVVARSLSNSYLQDAGLMVFEYIRGLDLMLSWE